jgi:geranylgeranyl pyrophosphate synthase
MLRVAAAGHRTLCQGQGDELGWARAPRPLRTGEVLDIFRRKTAPAFEVALRLGALLGGGNEAIAAVLGRYSNALGVAYQIRDDVQDMAGGEEHSDLQVMRPTLPLAVLNEKVSQQPAERALVERAWRRQGNADELEQVRRLLVSHDVARRCQMLQESFKEEALRALGELETSSLKGLLRRVLSKIFSVEVGSWCRESAAGNAPGGPAGAEAARGFDGAGR